MDLCSRFKEYRFVYTVLLFLTRVPFAAKPHRWAVLGILLTAVLLAAIAPATAIAQQTSATSSFLERPEVQEYIRLTAAETELDEETLQQLFSGISRRDRVIERISKPAEKVLQWKDYRLIFVKPERIKAGQKFMLEHADLLEAAATKFGVPQEIITAIIGVETFYGRLAGSDPALASLATLAFDYPPRAEFFRRELTEFLLLCKEEGFDPLQITGSYAAAMGMPQFISSSYRRYAIDFDGDGRRDLWGSDADVIGSVANYFAVHGWIHGDPVVERVYPKNRDYRKLLRKSLKPAFKAAQLAAEGVQIASQSNRKKSVMQLLASDGPQVWVGFHNFYVITRYNHSSLYAMAVYELSEAIKKSGLQ